MFILNECICQCDYNMLYIWPTSTMAIATRNVDEVTALFVI